MQNWGKNFGLVELRRTPITDTATAQQLTDGRLIPLTDEVAIPRDTYRTLEPWKRAAARAFAVGLTCDKAVVSGQSAARLTGLETLGIEDRTELQLPGANKPHGPGTWHANVRYRSTQLPEGQIEEHHGIRVTSLVRTLFDVPRFHGLRAGVVTIDSARRQNPWLTRPTLSRKLAAYPPFPGVRAVRQAISMSVGNSGSAQETIARLVLLEADLPQITSIEYQVEIIYDNGRRSFFVDILLNGWLIIEIDGANKYTGFYGKKTDKVLLEERARENILKNEGRQVLRFSAPDLKQDPDGDCVMLRAVADTLDNYVDRLVALAQPR